MDGRTTRSGRAVKSTVASPLPPTRATRRNSKKTQEPEEQVIEYEQEQEEAIVELDDEDDEVPNTQEVMAQLRGLIQPQDEVKLDDNESNSNFGFEQEQSDQMTFEHSSTTNNENNEEASGDAPNTYIDGLDEENANSFPSGCDENSKDVQEILESDDEAQLYLNQEGDVNMEEIQQSDDAPEIQYQHDIDEKPQESNTTGESDFAIAENLENGQNDQNDQVNDKTSTDLGAEMVSDDELPGPKLAELPADTENVSEEELPNTQNKKDGGKRKLEDYDPNSPTDDTESPDKKKLKTEEEEKAEKPKAKLPELDKFWKAVNDDSTDFTAWTYLLQYVDVENDIEAAREAYDAFLAHYPYCYGYWRKFADYEKRKGNKKKSEEVFERGLKAIPLSVDLWLHYLTHVKTTHAEEPDVVRTEFERALTACGLEFRSDKLWEAYIKWEGESKNIQNIIAIYERLLATPTQGYNNHFDNFQDVVVNNPVHQLVSVKEFKKLREDVRKDLKDSKEQEADVPPGEDEPEDHVRNDEEAQAIKAKITSKRKKIHKATVAEVTNRWTFEEGIKRPYFHVKPLERCQLKNWKEYLDFEIEQGDQKRILVLFERCLIACALYDEFWLKLIRYLETRKEDADYEAKIRDAYERACTIHHPDKPSLHLMWSAFEETHQNFTKGAEILVSLEKACPNLLQVAYRRINLERRRQDYDKVIQLYDHYISISKNKNISGSLSIKYARFLHKIKNDIDGSFKVLRQALEKDSSNTRAALQMIDLALQRPVVDENEILEIMDSFMARESIEPEQKVLFAQRKVEFLEDFGSTAVGLQEAQRALQTVLNKANESKKKGSGDSPPKKSSKDAASAGNGVQQFGSSPYSYASGQNNYYGNSAQYQSYGTTYDYNQQQWSGYQQNQQQQAYGNYGYGPGSYY